MLYASQLKNKEIVFRNEIIKIENDYRTGDVKDFYEKWNKLTKDNGVFDDWVKPYNFESKALTIDDLVEIKQEDSGFIFNRFLEILRHNVVSDKGNAFNRIFALFLCKIYDEKSNEGTNNELGFQWLEGIDDHRSFQLRLTDLYQKGVHEFLEKTVTDFSETEFNNKFPFLTQEQRKPILEEFRRLILEKNNEFAIKDVYDEASFNENAVVVKEIVELLQKFKLRYAKKLQYISDFFELLLTTGLKQESGQFFTPAPVAQFIIKSLPIDVLVEEKLSSAEIDSDDKDDMFLPYIIDYAAGSGHFITESMHEIQRLLDQKDDKKYTPNVAKKIRHWQNNHFTWAIKYIYGIEKDYRLVKVGKVGCYLHGDGLANVIHSDGLARFDHPDYKGKLSRKNKDFPQDNKQFDILVSNPPYSVSAFKNTARSFYKEEQFQLYDSLTDNSSEIECLFVERSKQLLKDNGVAGIILPSSILNSEGIYTKTREIILQYFEIIGVAALGSNTFMATGTNTVILFLRRRNNYETINLRQSVERFFNNFQDATHNDIDKPVAKYVRHVWENISLDDYITMLKKTPNKKIDKHEIYKEYKKNIKTKSEKDFWNTLIEIEKEKLFYFILAYPQKTVLIKTGEKDDEKHFLGYEFSNRRGNEGIRPIQRGKSIAECTRLFDENNFNNPEKASTYIYKAFLGDYDFPIHETLKDNIWRINLIDMIAFNRKNFDKNISFAVKKKVKIESKWNLVRLEDICNFIGKGKRPAAFAEKQGSIPFIISSPSIKKCNTADFNTEAIIIGDGGNANIHYINGAFSASDHTYILKQKNTDINLQFIYTFLYNNISLIENGFQGNSLRNVSKKYLTDIKIPLPPKEIQEKIVAEIEAIEKKETTAKAKIETERKQIFSLLDVFPRGYISTLCRISDAKCNPQNNPNKIFLYLGLEHIESNTGIYADNFTKGKNILSAKNVFCKNDVLYGKLRPYLNKVVIAKDEGICSTEILALKTDFPLILKYALLSDELVKQTNDLMKGVTLPRIGIKDFLNQKIPIPPLAEQQKVVSEIIIIEEKINNLQNQSTQFLKQKKQVLKMYL
ncbi:MAG: N-6 DNA methylase [Planctomycetaceae bacterium]|jgi:type I restriction enzyme M protein|nr:N-6 DNA methylase [Planctomycetaceae bacterium]